MTDIEKIKQKLQSMLENQEQFELEYGVLMPWNIGYKEAIEDVLHYLEHGEDD